MQNLILKLPRVLANLLVTVNFRSKVIELEMLCLKFKHTPSLLNGFHFRLDLTDHIRHLSADRVEAQAIREYVKTQLLGGILIDRFFELQPKT